MNKDKWAAEHPEAMREAGRRNYKNHPERFKARAKKYRADNPWVNTWYNAKQRGIKITKEQIKGLPLWDKCEICGLPQDKNHRPTNGGNSPLCLDHDHKTYEFRGLLCHSCNIGLGAFKDNPKVLRQAAEYLEARS